MIMMVTINDSVDAFPLDPEHNSDHGDGPDLLDPDDDNDGVPDRSDVFLRSRGE